MVAAEGLSVLSITSTPHPLGPIVVSKRFFERQRALPGSVEAFLSAWVEHAATAFHCEHAGVSAYLAKEIGYPVDLVMSYGGGPNVREKLLKRGVDKLKAKKLVIWMMTARDLHDHAEGWQPVEKR